MTISLTREAMNPRWAATTIAALAALQMIAMSIALRTWAFAVPALILLVLTTSVARSR